MDPKFQTSFIPKRPMIPGNMGVVAKKQTSVLASVSVLVIILTIIVSTGVVLYTKKLVQDNAEKKQQIKNEIDSLDSSLTNQLATLKIRVDSTKELLKNHLALTNFFDLLNKHTVSTIQFKDLTYSGGPGKPFLVKLNGQAKNFNDVVFQSDTILANPNFKNPSFSGFSLDKGGNVLFVLETEINPDHVSYQKILQNAASSAPQASANNSPASTTLTTQI
jgi:hypothetical protein